MTEMIWGYWLKVALRANVPFSVFMSLTPKKLQIFVDVNKEKQEVELYLADVKAHLIGAYVTKAITTCFAKNKKYPEGPMFYASEQHKQEINERELSEEEKVQLAVMRFAVYAQEFNTANKLT